MNHHPEFHNSYNIVSFSFCTHDAGMKITDLDIETARKISALGEALPGDAVRLAQSAARFPFPALLGKVARRCRTGYGRHCCRWKHCTSDYRELASSSACFPHPIRRASGHLPRFAEKASACLGSARESRPMIDVPNREFAGKVAIVTGGGTGVGFAVARAFARHGAHVAIAGRTKATLAHAAAAIEEASGAPVLTIEADVALAPIARESSLRRSSGSARSTSSSTTPRISRSCR